jgi:hypothetical protein
MLFHRHLYNIILKIISIYMDEKDIIKDKLEIY